MDEWNSKKNIKTRKGKNEQRKQTENKWKKMLKPNISIIT